MSGQAGHGIRDGDRVGYLSRNNPEFYEVMMACARIGAVFVPFNIRLSAGEIRYMAPDAGLSLLIGETFFGGRLPEAAEGGHDHARERGRKVIKQQLREP